MVRRTAAALLLMMTGCSDPPPPPAAPVAAVEPVKAFQPVHCTVSIDGMHCQNCANSLSRSMNGCSGVRSVAVSFEEKKATINAANSAALDCALRAARESGYTVGTPAPVQPAAPPSATPSAEGA